MLFYIYSDAPGSTIDITDRCRVDKEHPLKDNAEEGAVAISALIIDDPDGDLIITGHRRIYIYESEAPIGNQVVFNGFTANERVERGPYRTLAGRQWRVDLSDPDVLINRRIMNGTDANRPAETDLARIQALLTMTELNTVDDDTYVNTSASTVAMDACDYRGQNVGQYIDDCRQASGKNAYILYNETVGQYGLWYDFATSTVYDSGIFLANDLTVNQSTVFQISQERTYLNIDPSRVASGIYLDYDGGHVYVQDTDTTDAFAAIDWAAPSLNVKSPAKATARANRYLHEAGSEDFVIHTVMTAVPRAKVNVVKKGQLVQFRASWTPGFESYATCRVLYRTVTEISEDPEASYEIEMDLCPVPPPVDSFCILTWPRFAIGDSGSVKIGDPVGRMLFANSGDNPHTGAPLLPTRGLLSKITGPNPPAYVNWSGILVGGGGTLDIYWTTTLIWVHGGGPTYARWSIMRNGVEIGYDEHLHPNGTYTHRGIVDLTGVSFVFGDIIEAYLTFSGDAAPPTSFFSSPAGTGTGQNNRLEVSGSLS